MEVLKLPVQSALASALRTCQKITVILWGANPGLRPPFEDMTRWKARPLAKLPAPPQELGEAIL